MSCPCCTCMQIKICPITSRANFKNLADNMHHKKLIYFFNRLFFKVGCNVFVSQPKIVFYGFVRPKDLNIDGDSVPCQLVSVHA